MGNVTKANNSTVRAPHQAMSTHPLKQIIISVLEVREPQYQEIEKLGQRLIVGGSAQIQTQAVPPVSPP